MELNLADAFTSRELLMVVVPPWPAILTSDALVAKLSVEGPPELERKLTTVALDLKSTVWEVSVGVLLQPNQTSPSILKLLVPILVSELDSRLL